MENEANTIQEPEFVFRRLSEALHLGSKEVDGYFWLAILVPVLLVGVVYVIWMYVRDGRAVGWPWAAFLATLRCVVYAILALVFLLPGWQIWDKTETHSKVVMLIDVSGSMGSRDDLPTEAIPVEKLLTRQDKLIRFLTDEQIALIKRLQELNPVTLYRFGGKLDDEFHQLDKAKPWTVEEWNAWLKPDPKQEVPQGLNEVETKSFEKKLELHAQLVNGTNLGESLLAVLNREGNNMLQGVIVISDGRSTQFSTQTFDEVQARASRSKVPIFTVAVGEYRQPISIRIADLKAPDQARPDDKFPVRVDIDGEGLADQEVEVFLDITKPTGEQETLRPAALKLGETTKFKPGEPPHVQVEFEVEKPEIEGEWKLVARVPKDRREAFIPKEHVSDPVTVNVVKKPLRVLLFAGAPTREYQFLRTLMVRESDQRRAELSIYIQLARPEIVQDVPAERLLTRFPTTLGPVDDPQEKPDDKYYNLNQYDLVIAFDPDWTQLSGEQMTMLERWVEEGGGLVVIGGPVHTYQLARGVNYDKVRPILDLYPVVLDDSRRQGLGLDRSSTEPWRLNFPGATGDMEFLKLDEEVKEPLAGWERFFTGGDRAGSKEQALRRGFYSYYPVKDIKPSASVIATFTDPRARLGDGKEQPFLVSMPFKNGKIVYLGSGEMWRLRQFSEAFHERFWTKLARYTGSGNISRLTSRGDIYMSRLFTANNYVGLEARLRGRDMQPLARTEKPRIQIKPPAGANMPATVDLQPKPSQGAAWDGWFAGRFLVTTPGNYEIQLQIPGTGDILTRKFTVKESNPELDNTRPDLEQLRQVASTAGDVLLRVPEEKRGQVTNELERTNRAPSKGAGEDRDALRLYFDLKAAELVPVCMKEESKIRKSLGAVQDLWDRGFALPDTDPPLKVSYALLAIVGLLSIEWLTRKLLKLA